MEATTEDALEVIEQEAEAVGLALGVAERTTFARMLAERIALRLGGQLVYVSKRNREALLMRNAEIFRVFDGRNHDEIAREHGITTRQVRKILKNHPLIDRKGD